jgi:hypothetical protein
LETGKDELILEVPNPPPKKIRLQELEDGIDNLSQNGEGRISVTEDGNIASKNSNLSVCNVCLGILQEFCEKEFIKKVNNLFLIVGATMETFSCLRLRILVQKGTVPFISICCTPMDQ